MYLDSPILLIPRGSASIFYCSDRILRDSACDISLFPNQWNLSLQLVLQRVTKYSSIRDCSSCLVSSWTYSSWTIVLVSRFCRVRSYLCRPLVFALKFAQNWTNLLANIALICSVKFVIISGKKVHVFFRISTYFWSMIYFIKTQCFNLA